MNRCIGLTGFIFGHNFEEMANTDSEYYAPDPTTLSEESHIKREKVDHLYCVCMRCGTQVAKERTSIFTEEKK